MEIADTRYRVHAQRIDSVTVLPMLRVAKSHEVVSSLKLGKQTARPPQRGARPHK